MIAAGILTILVFNTVLLDIMVFSRPGNTVQPSETAAVTPTPQQVCSESCLSTIKSVLPSLLPTPLSESSRNQGSGSGPKEFFIPLGSGTNSTDDWTDVPGVAAAINPANYNGVRKVTFEASLRIPTGNERAYVRLYNVTQKHPVWYSDLSLEGGDAKLLVSPAISLDSGSNTYQVQMKTTLKFPALLDQARIRIMTY